MTDTPWIDCWQCGGEGQVPDCFEDCCSCDGHPDDPYDCCAPHICDVCKGEGGWHETPQPPPLDPNWRPLGEDSP